MAKTTPLRRQNLSDTIAARLRATIAGGELPAGAQLVGHRDLARQYEVSVGSVREALSMLMSEGLIEVRPGRGTFVAASAATAALRTAPLSLSEIHDLLDARRVIEARIASLAAERAAPGQLDAIGAALARMEAAVDQPESFIDADVEFHLAVAAAANNRYLIRMMNDLRDLLRHDMRLSVETAFRRTGTLRPSLVLHEVLAQRIRAADAPGATRAALAILERNEQFVRSLYTMAGPE